MQIDFFFFSSHPLLHSGETTISAWHCIFFSSLASFPVSSRRQREQNTQCVSFHREQGPVTIYMRRMDAAAMRERRVEGIDRQVINS